MNILRGPSTPTDGKKQSVEKTQPTTTSAISETDRERAEYQNLREPERPKQSSKKRKEIEGQIVIVSVMTVAGWIRVFAYHGLFSLFIYLV